MSKSDGLEESDGDALNLEAGDDEIFEQLRAGPLPPSQDALQALNSTYQDKLQDMLVQVTELLQKAKEEQVNLEHEKEETAESEWVGKSGLLEKPMVRVPVLQYIPPYFRDSSGMAPQPNTEAIFKKAQAELDPLVEPAKNWSKVEKNKLLQAIHASVADKELAPMKEKRNTLADEFKTAGQGEHEELTRQIAKLDKKIAKMASKVDISKQSTEVLQGLDWNKISATDMKGTRSELECRLVFFNMLRPTLNQEKQWGENELKRLQKIAEEHELHDWRAIATELGTGRTAFQCFEKYQTSLNPDMLKKEWNEVDDNKLREAVEACRMGDYIPWELVTGLMEGRTRAQCQNRWTRKLDPALKTGRWDEAEDEALRTAVRKYGVKGWRKIAAEVPGRTEAQCRERWSSALRGDIKTGNWTPDEDKLLMEGLNSYGDGKWSKVCTLLSGRTPAACKIRHRTLSKQKKDTKKGKRGRKRVAKKAKEEDDEAAEGDGEEAEEDVGEAEEGAKTVEDVEGS